MNVNSVLFPTAAASVSGNGSRTVTEPPAAITALAVPSAPVSSVLTGVPSAATKYTCAPELGAPPLVTVSVTGDAALPSIAASGAGGASGRWPAPLPSPPPHAAIKTHVQQPRILMRGILAARFAAMAGSGRYLR